jgi:hypothetical protein
MGNKRNRKKLTIAAQQVVKDVAQAAEEAKHSRRSKRKIVVKGREDRERDERLLEEISVRGN